ncbi:MAG: glycoside hydrolase family 2 TIM barrel-domain containing protein [Kiritimatiellia bacterium]|nr:glycoside hydrolase family 2 TIM barrel-domain containing protein [Kiritimatiellia bacterium]
MRNSRTIRLLLKAMLSAFWVVPLRADNAGLEDFNFNWRFRNKKEMEQARDVMEKAVAPGTDDSSWEKVDLPHDWAIAGPFDGPTARGDQGKLPWKGEGVYRKHFKLPANTTGKRLIIIFDGVMAYPTIYLNGKEVGAWRYGYSSFHLDVTDAANFGGDNILAVHANTNGHSSRWYPGAGIYRKVTALLKNAVHIPVWGTFVTTPEVTDEEGSLNISVEVINRGDKPATVSVASTCLSPDSKKAASGKSKTRKIDPGKTEIFSVVLAVKEPLRWDVSSPNLYKVMTTVTADGEAVDTSSVESGFRTVKVTINDGFILNGKRLQLQGVNLHHDHGPLGAAFFPRAMERQLQMMKEMGVNAIRTSHNMPAPELVELCDRMGFVVYNEAFDAWKLSDVKQHLEKEIRNFVRRDRNHPSVCFWSIGNEVRQKTDGEANRLLRGYVRKHDTTRNVSQGFCSPHLAEKEKGILDELDSSGWNYGSRYANARKNYPEKPILYTESASAFGTRGAYKLRLPSGRTDYAFDGECNAFVVTSARWSDIPEHEFERMINDRFVLGEFVWTGFDYLGEPTPYNGTKVDKKNGWVGRSSYFGIVDLAGLPKDSYYLYRSHWRPDVKTLALAPHWNWKGHEGEMIPVFGYTNGDEGELFLNGRSMGRKKKGLLDSNLARGKKASASSEDPKMNNLRNDGKASNALDENHLSDWRPAREAESPHHWQVDLEEVQRFNHVYISWARKAQEYEFSIETSSDGKNWSERDVIKREDDRGYSGATFAEVSARFLRMSFNQRDPAIRDARVMFKTGNHHFWSAPDDYFNVVGKYRLFWDNIPYEPGELKLVAYKQGKVIGETSVKTVGEPAELRLTADRRTITADGMDLSYVTIEMTDKDGLVCPRAMDKLAFRTEGPITLMGVANGNQMGLDSFTDATHPLFYGKAVAVLRSRYKAPGKAKLIVTAPGKRMKARIDLEVAGR